MIKLIRSLALFAIIVWVMASCSLLPNPSLTLTTTADRTTYDQVGQTITFSYTIKNSGNQPLGPAQFTVSDSLIGPAFPCGPAGTTLAPNTELLPPCTATYTITDVNPASISNDATASNGTITSPHASVTVNKSTAAVSALTLTTDANPKTYDDRVGQQITFSYTIMNGGSQPLGPAQFTVTDTLIGPAFNCGAPTTLAPNDLNSKVTCNAPAPYTITNTNLASISNDATASNGTITSPHASVTINKGTAAVSALTLTTDANPKTYDDRVGQQITFSYTIMNGGSQPLGPALFTVTDSLLGPGPFPCGPAGTTLAPNDLNSKVTCNAPAPYTITNTNLASISNDATASNGTITSPHASVTINKGTAAVPSLTLTTDANPKTYDQVGQQITFSYVIKNSGTVPLPPAQFTVTDLLLGSAPFNCGPATTTDLAPNDPNSKVTCNAPAPYTITNLNLASISNDATASNGAITSPHAIVTINKSGIVQTNPTNLVSGSTIQHRVVAGEWLWQIARCYGTDPNKMIQANPQLANPGQISPNTIVNVPNIGSVGTIYGPSSCVVTHTVQSGDTWNSIALQYNANPLVLQMVNSGVLSVGRVLKVPRNSAP